MNLYKKKFSKIINGKMEKRKMEFEINETDKDHIETLIRNIKIPIQIDEQAPQFDNESVSFSGALRMKCIKSKWEPTLKKFIEEFNNSKNYKGFVYCYETPKMPHDDVTKILKKSLRKLGIKKHKIIVDNERFLTIFKHKYS